MCLDILEMCLDILEKVKHVLHIFFFNTAKGINCPLFHYKKIALHADVIDQCKLCTLTIWYS